MPLLSDAKHCYVGNQPITKIMAGDLQVWPKGIPATDQVIINNYVYAVWPYQFVDCPSVSTDNWFRIGFDTNGSGTADSWQSWYTPGTVPGWWFYSPQQRMCMSHTMSRLDDVIVDMMYYQVQNRRTGQTVLTIK